MENIFEKSDKVFIKEILSRCIIFLYKRHPFLSYLLNSVSFYSDEKTETCSVSNNKTFLYNPKFIEELFNTTNDISLISSVFLHEILHLAFRHPQRGKNKEALIGVVNKETGKADMVAVWNIAVDLTINNMIVEEGLSLPPQGLVPIDNKYSIANTVIDDINHKSSEELYDELLGVFKDLKTITLPAIGKHNWNDMEEEEEESWNKVLSEAWVFAHRAGNVSSGIGREYTTIKKPKINWRGHIRNSVTSYVPFDYTWNKPSKKYISQGIYLPSVRREETTILTSIDTSGSIGNEQLSDFISELVGISKQFSNVEFRIITHDLCVHDDYKIYNGNINTIKNIKIHGGGGTSHIPLYEYILKQRYAKKTKLLISFTDGFSDFPKRIPIPTIFVMAGMHAPVYEIKKYGQVLVI